MFKNYFKTAWRNLIKDKQFSFLNLIGLSTGLACVLLIYLWVNDEMSIDKFNKNDSRLYQVLKKNTDGAGAIRVGETTQGLLAQSIAKQLPEVEFATCAKKQREPGILSFGDKLIKAKLEFAGKDFFNVFSYELIRGDKKNALADISNILLSDKTALKLFNTTDVIGKTVSWGLTTMMSISTMYIKLPVFLRPRLPMPAINLMYCFPFDLYAQKKCRWNG